MALVRDQETDRAVRALSLLSDVLRVTVNAGTAHETTLSQEIEFLTRYLEIERVRFGDRLRFTLDVPHDLHQALVPTFVLQPFVENSLKHGVLRDRTGNEITVRARVSADALTLTVTDDGRGLESERHTAGRCRDLNARARLERMYGGTARLSVRNAKAASGAVVEISLPFRTLAGAQGDSRSLRTRSAVAPAGSSTARAARDVVIVAECRMAKNREAIASHDRRARSTSACRSVGLDVARSASRTGPLVVFVTAYDRFALPAFETDAADYLAARLPQRTVRRGARPVQAMRAAEYGGEAIASSDAPPGRSMSGTWSVALERGTSSSRSTLSSTSRRMTSTRR